MDATAALPKYLEALPFLLMNVRAREMKAVVNIMNGKDRDSRMGNDKTEIGTGIGNAIIA